ncbi:hypothetical protein SADUNF_Sadunf18G0114500 [Salix dunnii]|uniref:Uncharacterized protein n=1 Tax=Salix dunnii TaxID=1413687 RepID=A0A835J1U0_9ROSI|nr:hypothetical protein SADUNF_Sadunf18G0114500 [Salix dunnii]
MRKIGSSSAEDIPAMQYVFLDGVMLCCYGCFVGKMVFDGKKIGPHSEKDLFALEGCTLQYSFPSASGFFYLCNKCEADPSCSVSCPFDDSQVYKVGSLNWTNRFVSLRDQPHLPDPIQKTKTSSF